MLFDYGEFKRDGDRELLTGSEAYDRVNTSSTISIPFKSREPVSLDKIDITLGISIKESKEITTVEGVHALLKELFGDIDIEVVNNDDMNGKASRLNVEKTKERLIYTSHEKPKSVTLAISDLALVLQKIALKNRELLIQKLFSGEITVPEYFGKN